MILSDHIFLELERALTDPYFTRRLATDDIAAYLDFVRRAATFTPLTVTVQDVAAHAADDLVLATAVSAQADYLVTGDKKLQGVGTFGGVTIVSARRFLGLLRAQ